jgi:hypothetical protein
MLPERERKAEEFRHWKYELDSRAPEDQFVGMLFAKWYSELDAEGKKYFLLTPREAAAVKLFEKMNAPPSLRSKCALMRPGSLGDAACDQQAYYKAKAVTEEWCLGNPWFVATEKNILAMRNLIETWGVNVTLKSLDCAADFLKQGGRLEK